MTQDEMAREAGFVENQGNVYGGHLELEAFAALVRADEREACARVCDDIATEDGWEGSYANGCAVAIRARGNT